MSLSRGIAVSLTLLALAASGCSSTSTAPASGSAAPQAASTTATPGAQADAGAVTNPSTAKPAGSSSPTAAATPTPTPTGKQLPGGGTKIFPDYRLAGYCGYPGAISQGELGIGDLETQIAKMEKEIKPYGADGRKVMPVMELIAATVQPVPGPDGTYRTRTDPAIIDEWLAAARKHKAMLLLNIQPGNADFLTESKALEKYLLEPDVGLALDPEWSMKPGEVPMTVFGSTTGAKLDEVSTYLSDLVAKNNLPEKVLLYHQLNVDIVRNPEAFKAHPGVVPIVSIDGIGGPEAKLGTYGRVVAVTPEFVHKGFKLFYKEDVDTSGVLMTAAEVMAITPKPDYVLYE